MCVCVPVCVMWVEKIISPCGIVIVILKQKCMQGKFHTHDSCKHESVTESILTGKSTLNHRWRKCWHLTTPSSVLDYRCFPSAGNTCCDITEVNSEIFAKLSAHSRWFLQYVFQAWFVLFSLKVLFHLYQWFGFLNCNNVLSMCSNVQYVKIGHLLNSFSQQIGGSILVV